MFDTFRGLPLHALIVHATVVLLPLMAFATAGVALLPKLRRYAWLVAVVDLLLIVLTWVTVQTGERLQARLGGNIAQHHADLARKLIFFVIAMTIAAVVVALARKSKGGAALGSVLSVVTAVALIFWTIQVGEAGSQAVWGSTIAHTSAPK
jgi:hypothetical protein